MIPTDENAVMHAPARIAITDGRRHVTRGALSVRQTDLGGTACRLGGCPTAIVRLPRSVELARRVARLQRAGIRWAVLPPANETPGVDAALPDAQPAATAERVRECLAWSGRAWARIDSERAVQIEARWLEKRAGVAPDDVVLFGSEPTADALIREVLAPIALGATVAVAPATDDWREWLEVIRSCRVSIAALPAACLVRLMEVAHARRFLNRVRLWIATGEPIPPRLAARVRASLAAEAISVFTVPEIGADVANWPWGAPEASGRPVGWGAALDIDVLDDVGRAAPDGAVGAVVVCGRSPFIGYAGDPVRTAAMATPDRHADPGQRLLATGLRGLMLESSGCALVDGPSILRRGSRTLEIAKAEAALLALPGVADAAVLIRATTRATWRVTAYVVPSGSNVPSESSRLISSLAGACGADAAVVAVSAIPLTSAGDVDRAALETMPVLDDDVAECFRVTLAQQLSGAGVVVRREAVVPASKPCVVPRVPSVPPAVHGQPSVLHGPGIDGAADPLDLASALAAAAESDGERLVLIDRNRDVVSLSYADLYHQAQGLGEEIRDAGVPVGSVVTVFAGSIHEFLVGFWAVVVSGCVPLPLPVCASVPTGDALAKLATAESLAPGLLLLSPCFHGCEELAGRIAPTRRRVTIAVRRPSGDFPHPGRSGEETAVLLPTSGSTGRPKVVTLTDRNLLTHARGMTTRLALTADDVSFNWMPLDHVGGLVFFHLRDVYARAKQVHAATEAILGDPLGWLDGLSSFAATNTWAPNFAYGLVNAALATSPPRDWDLGRVRYLFNGGEAVVGRTAAAFLRSLAPCGLPATAMWPVWGMSETSSGAIFSDRFTAAQEEADAVAVGRPIPGCSARIVDGRDEVVSAGTIGRLQVAGPVVTAGYYENPEQTTAAFTSDGWFDTGDLGLVRDGEIVVTGRSKDVIVVNGINYSNQEIESVVEQLPGVLPSFTAACSVRTSTADTEGVAVFFAPAQDTLIATLVRDIRRAVSAAVGVTPDHVVPLRPQDVPKTSIGKIQRALLVERFARNEYQFAVGIPAEPQPPPIHELRWRPDARRTPRPDRAESCLVVLDDVSGIADRLTTEHAGPTVVVTIGPASGASTPNVLAVQPEDTDAWKRIARRIEESRGERRVDIVHLWALRGADDAAGDIRDLRWPPGSGAIDVLHLLHAVESVAPGVEIDLLLVTSRSLSTGPRDGTVAPINGMLTGAVRSLSLLRPALRCRQIDCDILDAADVARVVRQELDSARDEPLVAIRHGSRLVARLVRSDPGPTASPLRLRTGGVYVVTGALGGVGHAVCRRLIDRFGARLLLAGRSRVVDDGSDEVSTKAARLRDLRSRGDVVYEAGDVSSAGAAAHLLSSAERRWGGIDGVFHLAGVGGIGETVDASNARDALEREIRSFDEMIAAKVHGTWALVSALRGRACPLIAFSSATAVVGTSGHVAYAAANAFVDACVSWDAGRRGAGSRSIGWTTWRGLGMMADAPDYIVNGAEALGYGAIDEEVGWHALLDVLSRPARRLFVGLDDTKRNVSSLLRHRTAALERLVAQVPAAMRAGVGEPIVDAFGTTVPCAIETADHAGPITARAHRTNAELEQLVADAWRQVLGVVSELDENFFEAGGSSLRLYGVKQRLDRALGRTVAIVDLLRFPTIESLARRLGQTSTTMTSEREAQPLARPRPVRRRRRREADRRQA